MPKNVSETFLDVACRYEVEEMLGEVEEKRTGHPGQPCKPLLRLRVEFNDEAEMINPSRLFYIRTLKYQRSQFPGLATTTLTKCPILLKYCYLRRPSLPDLAQRMKK